MKKINKNLTPEENHVLFEKGTEIPFTGKLLHNNEKGNYACKNCGAELFSSDAKFDSGTGWPSFDDATNVKLKEDNSGGMKRTEVLCKNCGAHLGHLFNDGPTENNNRYCINSICLDFKRN
ncbi:MAG: peptide-methionine (R)-S-oxide reductase MsrB [archaeon]|nr:peptide-methionine (R)-S-oxide reductase MsrB [archaeon]